MDKNCIFCNPDKERIIYEDDNWYAMYDGFPVSDGHTLLIPREHYATYFDLPDELRHSLNDAIVKVKGIVEPFFNPTGWNIGCNCGKSAGQTVMHFHLHLIPRYDGDVENPRGGVRGVIPSKQNYNGN